MSRPFGWLMAALLVLLALGIVLLVLGVSTSPYALPFAASM